MSDPSRSDLAPGLMLAHYRLVEKLGEGGMGVVWKALDTQLDREVALKSLPAEYARDAERLARFEREAKVLAGLSHSGIAAIHGLHVSGERSFIAMELAAGEDLSMRIARGALPMDEAIDVALQLAQALEAAHESGVVHRDLKPANIKLSRDGKIKVLDFGLAKALEAEGPVRSGSANITQSPTVAYGTVAGVILGTAGYMSPEQARGRPVDRRADIWAFGCVLFEMLTGRQTFEGETVSDTLASILKTEPDLSALPSTTPRAVVRLIERCLVKDPTRRLRDIGEARIALENVGADVDEPQAGLPAKPQPLWWSALPWAVATLAIVAAVTVFLAMRRGEAPRPVVRLSIAIPDSVGLSASEEKNLALSPAGDHLAFVGRIAGGLEQIYVRPMVATRTTALAGTEGARDLAFSPDGRWIAFESGGKLKRIAAQGGSSVELCDVSLPRGIDWGEDGTIVFTPATTTGLYKITEAGGTPTAFTTIDSANGERTHRWPHILPDGKHVLFTVGTIDQPGEYDDARIDVVALDGSGRKTIYQGASMALYAATGHLLLGRTGTLLAVPFDLGSLEVRGAPVPVVQGVAGAPSSGVLYVGLDRFGSLAYVEDDQEQASLKLAWVDRKGALSQLPAPARDYRDVSLSPDETRALLSIGPGGGGRTDVFIYHIASQNLNRMTFDERSESPVWSPDGQQIAFHSNQAGHNRFIAKRADGSGSDEILYDERSTLQTWLDAWAPDGQSLIFGRYVRGTLADIWQLPLLEERTPHVLVDGADSESESALSPDGKWLAHSQTEGGQTNVYVRAFPGPGGRWQVTPEGGSSPAWSRDGRELFFIFRNELWSCPIESGPTFVAGRPRSLFTWPGAQVPSAFTFGYAYDVSRDGRRFLTLVAEERSRGGVRLQMALNWLGELERLVPAR